MNKNQLFTHIILLLVGVIFLLSQAGCGGQVSEQEKSGNSKPFYTDKVATIRIVMSEESWKTTQENPMAEEYVMADFWFDDELVPDVAVRPKGNSSLMSVARSGTPRMSLKVDFNFFNSARSFNGIKKINFNNGFSDPTLMREVLSYDLFEQMGLATPRHSFVDLWVNDTHLGLYTMVEQIDKTFLADNFTDANGNLYKPEMPAAFLNWSESDLEKSKSGQDTNEQNKEGDNKDYLDVNLGGGNLSEILQALEKEELSEEELPVTDDRLGRVRNIPFVAMPPDGMGNLGVDLIEQIGLKTNENKPDHSALFKLLEVLNNETDEIFKKEIEKVLDVDQVLRYIAVSTVLVHLDNYIGMGHNYYLYEIDGKFTIIPWDLNMSFGGFSFGVDRNQIINYYIDEPTIGPVDDRPLVSKLLAIPLYLDTYHRYLEEIISGPFSSEVMDAKIDKIADMIRPFVQADTYKFYSTRDFEKGLGEDVSTSMRMMGMGINIGLKAFVSQRVESIYKQLQGELPSRSIDGTGNGGKLGDGWFPGNIRNQPPVQQNPANR